MSTEVFYGLLVVFLVVIEAGRPAVSALQAEAGVEPIPRGRRVVIDIVWYAVLVVAAIADLLGSQLASTVMGVLFLCAAALAVLSVVTILGWIWKSGARLS